MEYLEIEKRPDLGQAQVSKPENIVEVGEDGNPPFYNAIYQMLDDENEALQKAEDVQERRAAMKVVGN